VVKGIVAQGEGSCKVAGGRSKIESESLCSVSELGNRQRV